MRVGILGDQGSATMVAAVLESTGHTVAPLTDVTRAGDCEAIILGVPPQQTQRAVEILAPHIRRGQIVIITALTVSLQDLDDLEVHGAVIVGLTPILDNRWAVTAWDELGETVAGLLLGEAGITAVLKTDAERRMLAAHLEYAHLAEQLAADARVAVSSFMESPEVEAPLGGVSAAETIAAFDALEEPGARRAYLEAARRTGEIRDIHELEIWAMQEESR